MDFKSIFGDKSPEFSAEYDLLRFNYEKKVEYPVVLLEVDEMDGNM